MSWQGFCTMHFYTPPASICQMQSAQQASPFPHSYITLIRQSCYPHVNIFQCPLQRHQAGGTRNKIYTEHRQNFLRFPKKALAAYYVHFEQSSSFLKRDGIWHVVSIRAQIYFRLSSFNCKSFLDYEYPKSSGSIYCCSEPPSSQNVAQSTGNASLCDLCLEMMFFLRLEYWLHMCATLASL